MIQGILLDRDGTINVERREYVRSGSELVLLPGALAALVRLTALNVPIVVVTNQSCVGRGLISSADLDTIHADLAATVRAAGGRIDAFYACTHLPNADCSCRKPRPGLLHQAMADFGLRAANCVMVGDSLSDCGAASAAGCRCILVCTGRQGELIASTAQHTTQQNCNTQDNDNAYVLSDPHVAPSLWHASRLILEQAYRVERGKHVA